MAEDNRNPSNREALRVRDASLSATLRERLAREIRNRGELLERAVREAPQTAALDTIAREAHRLAGACAYCGEKPLQRAALALESAAGAASAARSDPLYHRWREVARLIAAILEKTDPRA